MEVLETFKLLTRAEQICSDEFSITDNGNIIVMKKSLISGNVNSITIDMPFTEFLQRYIVWKTSDTDKRLVQNSFPELTTQQREFLISGITEKEWENTFYQEEE